MARPSNQEILDRYQSQIRAAKKYRKTEGFDHTWKRLIRLYRGKHYEYYAPEDRMLVNMAFSMVNVIEPSVAVNHPKITVNATKPEDGPRAIITEAVTNYWWRRYRVRPQFRRAVKDFLIVGHGWVKCGYRYVEEEQIPTADDASDPSMPGNEASPTIIVTEDRPFVERVSPFDVFVDPDGTSMEDIGWIAQRVRRTLKEVKADKRYSPTVRATVSPSAWRRDTSDTTQDDVRDKEMEYVDVWEFYDIRKKTIAVFTDGSDGFLIAPRPMPYDFGHPFVMIRNYDIPDEFYPLGDLEAVEPLQRELNETRSQMMNHRKKYARKYLVRENALDGDGLAALESDTDNQMVMIKHDGPLTDVIAPMPAIISPPDFYNQSNMIQQDMSTVSGVSEYMRGQMPNIRRTATEAGMIADASNARSADKLAIIEDSISQIASRMIQLAQQFMTGEQVARITGQNGQPVWVTFDADYIAGDFDFEVEGGSTQPNNESFRRQSALQMVDAMAPFIQMGVVNPTELARHVLQFGFGVKNPDEFMAGPPPAPAQDPNAPQQGDPNAQVPPDPNAAPPGMPPGMPPAAPGVGALPQGMGWNVLTRMNGG